jgi:hypothetical protein
MEAHGQIRTEQKVPATERHLAGLPYNLALVLIGLLALHLGAAAFIPFTEDEAYYRLWSEYPAFGYYDHPPMMAWWIAAGRALMGDTPLGARLLAVFATTITSLLIYRIAQLSRLSNGAAARAAIFYNASILVCFGSHLIVPDCPSTLFWTATLFAVLKARDNPRPWWLAAGVFAGLAVLSKYSALFIAPGIVLWLAWSPEGRKLLTSPWPWAAALIAGLLFSTNVIWNAGHGWVSFQKQFGRAAPEGFTPRHLFELISSQAMLFNPLLAPLMVIGARQAVRLRRSPLDGRWLIICVTVPFGAYLVLHSLHAGVLGHWPAPLYPGLAVLAAAASEGALGWERRLARMGPPFGIGLTGLALVYMAAPGPAVLGKLDLSGQFKGWPAFANTVEMIRQHVGADWVGTLSFGQAAMLDGQGRVAAPVLQITERSRYQFQPAPDSKAMAGPGLVIDYSRRVRIDELKTCFGEVWPLGTLRRGGDGQPLAWLSGLGLTARPYDYTMFRVVHPKVDLVKNGCWEAKTLEDSLKAKEKRRQSQAD